MLRRQTVYHHPPHCMFAGTATSIIPGRDNSRSFINFSKASSLNVRRGLNDLSSPIVLQVWPFVIVCWVHFGAGWQSKQSAVHRPVQLPAKSNRYAQWNRHSCWTSQHVRKEALHCIDMLSGLEKQMLTVRSLAGNQYGRSHEQAAHPR